ncbi:MAG: PQQ-like beta-propeller repeat protein, partial [Deltaproteobacteria bacterium]|nr:PQQ-like beta-propeller repeat protein [Deltaproteobacteria bacterium]
PVKPKWTFTSPGGHGISSPTAIGDDGKLYVGTWKNRQFKRSKMKGHSGTLCSLFPDGTLDWMHDSERGSLLASGVESSPLLLSDGKIIFGKDDGHVYALNLKGEVIWDFSCDDPSLTMITNRSFPHPSWAPMGSFMFAAIGLMFTTRK